MDPRRFQQDGVHRGAKSEKFDSDSDDATAELIEKTAPPKTNRPLHELPYRQYASMAEVWARQAIMQCLWSLSKAAWHRSSPGSQNRRDQEEESEDDRGESWSITKTRIGTIFLLAYKPP
jgi:hypothetical protein